MNLQLRRMQKIGSALLALLLGWNIGIMPAEAAEQEETPIAITAEHFPDAVFRNYVSNQIDTSPKDGFLSSAEIQQTNSISLTGAEYAELEDLTGISCFSNLMLLNCIGTNLKELDLSQNKILGILNCTGNQIASLTLPETTTPLSVDCSNNQLTELQLSGNMLQILNCSENQLSELDFSKVPNLTTLDCSGNHLTSLDITSLSQLTSCTCENNAAEISAIPVSGSDDTLYYADLSALPGFDVSRVAPADASSDTPFFTNGTLLASEGETRLYILDITAPVTYTYQINTADTSATAVFTLHPQQDPAYLVKIDANHFPDAALRDVLSGSAYDKDQNGFFSQEELDAVTMLSLSGTGVSDYTGLSLFSNLKELDCSQNQLQTLDLSVLPALTTLNCSGNQLKALDLSVLPSLTVLNCASNLLTSLDVTALPVLQTLNCSGNRLTALNLGSIPVADLIADGNAVSLSVGADGCISLQELGTDFDLDCVAADSWQNASVANGVLTISDLQKPVSYSYYVDTARSQTVTFTLYPVEVEIAIDETHFPDSVFCSAVEALDTDQNGMLSQKEIQQVTELDVSNRNIWDLTGISYLTALQSLNCSGNKLKELTISGLSRLHTLDCSDNSIRTMTLEALPALSVLRCGNNRLTQLEPSAFPNLTVLTCMYNQLQELDLTGLSGLTELDCSNQNHLDALDLSQTPNLRILNCASVGISQLDLTQNPMLESVNCSFNQLKSLNLRNQTQLQVIRCASNQLTSVQVATSLTELTCYGSKNSSSIPADFVNRISFADLPGEFDVSHVESDSWTNAVTDGKALYVTDITQPVTYIYDLIAGNAETGILFTIVPEASAETQISIDAAHFPDDAFRNYLKSKFDSNRDGYFSVKELSRADDVEISGLDIADLTGVEYLTSLKKLNCSNNALTEITIANLSALEELNCAGNNLTTLHVEQLSNLKRLYCSYNALESLDVSTLTNLAYLSCEANLLTDLSLPEQSALVYFYCYDNALESLSLKGLTALQYLECQDNALAQLDVSSCQQLLKLNCQGNRLVSLDVTGLLDLQEVNASGNSRTIEVKAILTYDLTQMPSEWEIDRVVANSWKNAACDGMTLTVQPDLSTVTYTYQLDAANSTKTADFQLIPVLAEETSIPIDAAHFPDEALRQLVRQELDRNDNGLLEASESEAVTTWDISGHGIADLTGLEYLLNLSVLNCSNNALTSLPENLSEQLTELDCSKNQLTTLSLGHAAETLTSLNCAENALTELQLSAFPALLSLDCHGNTALQSLTVPESALLETLNCAQCSITTLSLQNPEKLRILHCAENQLTDLDFSGFSVLEQVDCSQNQLKSFSADSAALTDLDCHGNALQHLSLEKLLALKTLNCADNQLSFLDLSLQMDLTSLSAGENPLLSLLASPLANVTTCDLSNCTAEITPVLSDTQTLTFSTADWTYFNPERTGDWSNAVRTGTEVKILHPQEAVSYTYQTGNAGVLLQTTLVLSEIPIGAAVISRVDETTLIYNGDLQTPEFQVVLDGVLLSPGEDYTITYENNCNAGTAAAIIQAENGKKWTGSVLVPFSILKASPIVAVVLSPEGDYTAGDAAPEITLTENSTPGSVSWSAGMPSRLTEGEQTLSWDYIPSDAQNYEAVSGTRVLYAKPIATTTTTPVTTVTTTTTTTTTTETEQPVTTTSERLTVTSTVTTTSSSGTETITTPATTTVTKPVTTDTTTATTLLVTTVSVTQSTTRSVTSTTATESMPITTTSASSTGTTTTTIQTRHTRPSIQTSTSTTTVTSTIPTRPTRPIISGQTTTTTTPIVTRVTRPSIASVSTTTQTTASETQTTTTPVTTSSITTLPTVSVTVTTSTSMTTVMTTTTTTTTTSTSTTTTTESTTTSTTITTESTTTTTTTTSLTKPTTTTRKRTITTVTRATQPSGTTTTVFIPQMVGDANLDGAVDIQDAYAVLVYYAEHAAGNGAYMFYPEDMFINRWLMIRLDIDGDGDITIQDALYVLTYYSYQSAGKSVTWEEIIEIVD